MAVTLSCHCGAVACELAETPTQALSCNCSICRRKAPLLHFASPESVEFRTPREALSVYTFGNHAVRHQFCSTCGCSVFGEGAGKDGKPVVALNLRCAEGLDLDALAITHFDGASL